MDAHPHLSAGRRRARRRLPLLGLLGLGLVAAGPAPEEAEVRLGVAYGRYEVRPDTYRGFERRHRILEPAVDGAVRYRFPRGFTVAVGGSLAPGVLRDPDQPDIEPDPDPGLAGDYAWSGVASAQLGRHGEWIGFQVGPALVARPGRASTATLAAGELWVGRPDVGYAWASLLQLPHTGAVGLGALGGVGHRSTWAHLEVGTSGAAWLGRAGLRVREGAWLQAELAGGRLWADQEQGDVRGRLGVSLLPMALAGPSDGAGGAPAR